MTVGYLIRNLGSNLILVPMDWNRIHLTYISYFGKDNECLKSISLENIFKNFL